MSKHDKGSLGELSARVDKLENGLQFLLDRLNNIESSGQGRDLAPKREPVPVLLRNAGKAAFVSSVVVPRSDGELIFEQHAIAPGAEDSFDGSNPSVQISAKGGLLVPSDDHARAWLKSLK